MKSNISKYFVVICLSVLLSLQLAACGMANDVGQTDSAKIAAEKTVDPLFKEFYQTLGGHDMLGSPLTLVFVQGDKRCQYTEVALMCYNPAETDVSRRFMLSPLGKDLGLQEKGPRVSAAAAGRDLGNGFYLYDEFSTQYDRIYGALYAGRPLTQVRVNQSTQRIEQFFENVGFYRNLNDPAGKVHLITYGAYLCGPDCSRNLPEYWGIVQTGLVPQPFELSVSRLGWSELGGPLAQPRIAEDGFLEQVYDNVVLYAPPNDPSQVRFRPLINWLGVAPVQPLVEPVSHEQLVFYEVENGLGHNVARLFDSFIATHGGPDLAGKPLTEVFTLEDGKTLRQCFESYCLDYNGENAEGMKVRMAPLGLEYARRNDPKQILRLAFSPETVSLKVEEESPQLTAGKEQIIRMHVFHLPENKPMYLVEGTVTFSLPDGSAEKLAFKPTDRDGTSQVTLHALQGLANLSVVEYQVCLNLPGDPKICTTDSFIYRAE